MKEPKIEKLGGFTLKIHYWFSELENRPFYSHALFLNGKSVLVIPTANKQFTIEQVIGMWRAKEMR